MARNGSGTFSLLAPLATANTVSSSTTVNDSMTDVATALTESINKDGTKAWAANQSLGSNKFTSVGDGSARTDSVALGQVQDGKLNWVDGGGTADAITATYAPAITALVDGQLCYVRATAANTTTTPTFAPSGLTARTIVKNGGVALAVGDIVGDGHELILRYLLASTRWELLNPAFSTSTASTTEQLTGTSAVKASTPDSVAALWEAGSDITDGAAITIGEGGYFNLITSTTAITSFSVTTDKAGRTFRVRFNTARTLTHNATSLIIPGGANVTTAQGDIAQIRSLGSGNVVVDWYTKADGTALIAAAGVSAASQAEQETGTEAGKYVAPATQQFHPSAAKFWSQTVGFTQVLTTSYNVTSRTDVGTGILTITIATDFSSGNWCAIASCDDDTGGNELFCNVSTIAAGTVDLTFSSNAGSDTDTMNAYVVGFGDQ